MSQRLSYAILLAIAASTLVACDQQVPEAADVAQPDVPNNNAGAAHWEKVCAKGFFYSFQEDRKDGATTYCSEWQNKCVDADGNPSDDCA